MDGDQAFEFDLHGVLVIKDVLDAATVAVLRSTMAQRMVQQSPEAKAQGNGPGRVRGNPLGMGASMLHWGKPCRCPCATAAHEHCWRDSPNQPACPG